LLNDRSAGKRYTIILKDNVSTSANGQKEQSTISYEYDFEGLVEDDFTVEVAFSKFKATYRGKEDEEAKPLKIESIRRFSIMMRSFFGNQEGPFYLPIKSISAYKSCSTTDING